MKIWPSVGTSSPFKKFDQRGFSAAVWTEKTNDLSRHERKRYLIQSGLVAVAFGKAFAF